MRELHITLPEMALVAGTRAALGVGLGLLLGHWLPEGQRRAVGWTLLLIGGVSSVPLAFELLGKLTPPAPVGRTDRLGPDPRAEFEDGRNPRAALARS